MARPLRALTLAALAAALLTGGGTAGRAQAAEKAFDIVGLDQLDGDGVASATHGLVMRLGERQIIADAARYDQRSGELYATGHVVYRQPGIRIAATRLGLRLPPGHQDLSDFSGMRGDAWDVEARVETATRSMRINAARMEFREGRLVFRDVHLDLGHGGIVSFDAPTVEVTLRRPRPDEPADDPRSHVAGVALVSPAGKVVGLPVFWLPYLYRDFSRRYPWTRIRSGSSDRLGTWGRFWIGSDLPEMMDWRPGLDARVDDHSRAGWGYGLRPYWRHPTFGSGDLEWYAMPDERVRDTGGVELQHRRAQAFDGQHQVDLGAGAAYGRFTRTPGPDAPGTTPAAGAPPDYRFLQDYLPERLEHDPFPRQGATLAYDLPGVTATVDTERRINPADRTTERWFGVQAQLHPVQLAGPLHLGGDSWVEDLHRIHDGTDATRLTSRGYLASGGWLDGGYGADADAGIKELRYSNGLIAGVPQEAAARRAFFADAGVKLRLENTYGALTHSFVPRVGIQVIGDGAGQELPAYGFGDGREDFEEDARYWVAGFDTGLVGTRTLFHASVVSRWAVRRADRGYIDDSGTAQTAAGPLADISGRADGSPVEPLRLTAAFTYDARPRRWSEFNTSAAWRISGSLALKESSTLVPDDHEWSHTPGLAFYLSRYRFDGSLTLRPGGASVDSWLVEATRRMVDGELFIGYEFLRGSDGSRDDQRVALGFTLGAAPRAIDDDAPSAKTSLTR